ncbi:MAG TPA: tRNA (adenosine(37)-N6)-dimethylallyltransferase MiaA [Fusobacterium sp.]|uniref:tRNA (adenosine(37)-N6)-dimethylallyltransferase MiaA n=1 Tax=Fusobacterium sp. TaxID=68766 RepID=UPI002F3F637F
MERKAIILGGPTGVGKTSLSIILAKELGADIISADSAQVYRGLDIGTAKIKKEEMEGVPHHLLNVIDPVRKYSVGEFAESVNSLLQEKYQKKENILLVGGTGLYLSAVSDGLSVLPSANVELREQFLRKRTEELYQELLRQDPLSANKIHPNNRVRIERALEIFALTGKSFALLSKQNVKGNEYSFYKVALERDRGKLYERIDQRVDIMIEEGLEEEVRTLYQTYGEALKKLRIIGYAQMIEYLDGVISLAQAIELIKRDSRHYAKRQFTWFKQKKDYIWYNLDERSEEEILADIKNFLIKK